jgi:multimeric flavodoxin WrbA
MSGKRLLLINGSPRKNGTSFSFARTVKKLAEDGGNTAEIIHIIEYLDGAKNMADLKCLVSKNDIIGLITPLYVDTLPYPVIWFMEKLSAELGSELRGKGFFAISQNGFPDITLFEPLLGSCRCFAESTGMQYMGGLGYGGGAIIDGALLEDLGKKGEKITAGFKLALESICRGEKIPSESQEMITMKIPKIFYWPLAVYLNRNARKTAREKYGITDLRRRVYLDSYDSK